MLSPASPAQRPFERIERIGHSNVLNIKRYRLTFLWPFNYAEKRPSRYEANDFNPKPKIDMPHRQRKNIRPGLRVAIVLKQDQRTGRETIGTVKDLLTNSAAHPHGIKVRLADGQVGRVQKILNDED
jgi:uncharacterized repeat protein (TIGR03833 family)